MTGFVDGLAKILKDKFKFSADILKSVKKVQIGCDNSVHITNNTLYIDPRSLDKESNDQLLKSISIALKPENKEAYLVLAESEHRLTELKRVNSHTFDIDFFKDKIQPVDFNILKISVYRSFLFLNGDKNKADEIKKEAISRYGELARNIINLHSSSYFENTIKPLYEILSESGDLDFKEKFNEMYRIIVMEEIFTLFISSNQTPEQALQKFKEKIEINKSYGAYKINIHGINTENVSKVEFLVQSVLSEIDGSPQIIKTGQAIMVKISLKKNIGELVPRGRNDLVTLF